MQIFHIKTAEAQRILDRHALSQRLLAEGFERFTLLERVEVTIIGIGRCGVYYVLAPNWQPYNGLEYPTPLGFVPWMIIHELLDDLVNACADALDAEDDHGAF
jgi:hypothetical protein